MKKTTKYSSEDKVLLAVDCIIFGFDEEGLKLLLIKRDFEPEKGKWSLMGGFMHENENLDDAAARILEKLTGLKNIYMDQLHAFSKVDRDPEERTISVAYFALINIKDHHINLAVESSAQWFLFDQAPKTLFDHPQMIEMARRRLQRHALTKPIGFELLPEKFTMRQLQNLYEAILDKELDKRNFISKINSLKVLQKLEEKDTITSKKGAFLYRFDEEKYHQMKEEGYRFKI